MSNSWNIANSSTNKPVGDALDTLYIEEITGGYQLLSTDAMVGVLATVMTNSQNFKFEHVPYAETTWKIHVLNLPPQAQGGGTWSTPDPEGGGHKRTAPESGDFTAAAGTQPLEVGSSAKAR